MATKITTALIESDAITSAHIGAAAITNADLHTNMDLTGKTVLVANASTGDNDTTAANTAFVQQEIAALVDSAPGTLNTLNELAAALGDDANFSTTVTNSIAGKLPLDGSGTMTGHIQLNNAIELRSKDTSSAVKTIARVNSSNELEYGWSGNGPVKFMGGGSYTERMRIHTDGKIGIGGVDSPSGDLHLKHASTNSFTASDDSWHTIVLHNNDSAATNTTGIAFEVSGSAYHVNAGTGIAAVKNGTNSDYGADLVFITRPQSAVAAERMRITDAGYVGIGHDDPASGLHVKGTNNTEAKITMTNTASANTWSIHPAYNNQDLLFMEDGDTRVTFEEGGQVGIGASDPEGPLHVRSADNEVIISDISLSSGSFTWQSFRRNNTNKFRVFGDANDSQFGFYNDATGSTAGYYPFVITTGNNSTGSNFVGLNTDTPAKPLHVKRTSGWATMRLEGASDSGGEIELYAGSNLKAKLWADNTDGDIYIRAGGSNTQFIIAGDGNWVGPHEDNVKRNFIGRGPFNVFDFSDNWHEFYNPAANTEHHISGSFTNAMGVSMTFPSNVTKKILQHDRTPTGTVGVIYEAVSNSSSTWNGGWNSGQFRTDPDKGYIFGYYCRRITSATDGTHYAGFSHGVSAGTGTNVDSNPYFQAFGNGNLPQNIWTLHYYHLHPRYYSGTGDGGIGGVYRCDNGTRILGQTAWKQPVNQTYQVFRTYNYYCANPAVAIQWYAPFVYEVNGHEPTPAALLVNT